MSRRSSLFTLSASLLLAIVGPATAGPKELGAFVKGEWKANERPEVSIVMFRWGASGEKTLTSSKDRMLGQIASRGQTRIEIVMRTPPSKSPSSSGATSPPPSYEVRLQCGVQICGDGIFVPCGECPFARKYNGDSLVSRGAYTSNICCFNAVFERVSGVDTLHIVDVIANGKSVPYMIKFNVKPTIMRSGTVVPIPAGSRLHGARVSFHKLEDDSGDKTTVPQNAPPRQPAASDDWHHFSQNAVDGASSSLREAVRYSNNDPTFLPIVELSEKLLVALDKKQQEADEKSLLLLLKVSDAAKKARDAAQKRGDLDSVLLLEELSGHPDVTPEGNQPDLVKILKWRFEAQGKILESLRLEQAKLLRSAVSSLETMKITQTKAGNFALALEIATYQDIVRQQKALR